MKRNRRRVCSALAGIAVVCAVTACGEGDPLDTLVAGEQGRVVRVIDGDALVLNTGQSVRLVSVEAPAGAWRDRPAQPHADQSSRILEDLALGREVRLYYAGLSRDRYDRALAHVVTTDALGPEIWLNLALVERGAARVRVYPDTARAAEALLVAEVGARREGIGLWSVPEFAVMRAGDVDADTRGFVILDGVLDRPVQGETGQSDDAAPACERALLSSRITVSVRPSASSACDVPTGQRVLVRGYLRAGRLDLTHRLNVSPIDQQMATDR